MLVCVQGGRRRGVQEGQVPPDFADVEKGTEALNIQLNLLVVTPQDFLTFRRLWYVCIRFTIHMCNVHYSLLK